MPEPDEIPPAQPDPSLPTEIGSLDPGELFARGMQTAKMSGGGAHGWVPPTPEEVGPLFPHYEILSMLGRGGMGAVYQARQTSLDRLVAIKLLPLEISVNRDFADRFRREARAMAKLNHPHIISVHDFGQTSEGHLYFTMEFVEGANLHDIIHGPGLAPDQALSIAVQICTALAYAHGKGVVHRDMKPANVMIDTESQVKVADFGLARLTDPTAETYGTTVTGTVMGTPDYMAPEQMKGMNVDHRADIYSLGVMLYEMLCRETPRGAFDLPSERTGCDPRLDKIVLKAMSQTPDRRYQSTTEMKADVESARTPLPELTPHVVTPLRVPERAASKVAPPKRWAPAVTLAVAVLAVVAALVYLAPWKKGGTFGRSAEVPKPAAMPTSPEPWQPALGKPLEQLATADGKRTFLDGWLTVRDGLPPVKVDFARGMARVRIGWLEQSRAVKFGINDANIELDLNAGGAALHRATAKGYEPNPPRLKLPAPLTPGTEVDLQVAWLNGRIYGWVQDQLVGSQPLLPEKSRISSVALFNDKPDQQVRIRRFEVLNLDGLPDAEALKLAGISEAPKAPALPVSASASFATATQAAPFVNTLGMKFVPVPITGGPTGGQRVLFSVWETRLQDYAVFATQTKREWPKPDFAQGPTHPAVLVNWDDAQAFCAWLTERERKSGKITVTERYRIPTDHEWSCAVGIGDREDAAKTAEEKSQRIPDLFPWGSGWPPPAHSGNYRGEETKDAGMAMSSQLLTGYRDNFPHTAPVGSFAANQFGLFDLGGNAREFCEDQVRREGKMRVGRGVSFFFGLRSELLSSHRGYDVPAARYDHYGFRVVLAPAASTPPVSANQPPAIPLAKQSPGSPIKLLPLVRVARDATKGSWSVKPDGLALEMPAQFGVLESPYEPPEEYDFEAAFTPTAGDRNPNFYLRAGGASFAWKVNAHGRSPALYGFDILDGKMMTVIPEAAATHALSIENGRRYTTRVEVRRGGLRGFVNGLEMMKWSGDFRRFSLEDGSKLRNERALGIGSYKRAVVFHSIEVREVTGAGKLTGGADSAARGMD